MKIENRDSKFCAEFDADSKTLLVFIFLSLIVFDFYSFEDSKHILQERQIYIYIYIYIFR